MITGIALERYVGGARRRGRSWKRIAAELDERHVSAREAQASRWTGKTLRAWARKHGIG